MAHPRRRSLPLLTAVIAAASLSACTPATPPAVEDAQSAVATVRPSAAPATTPVPTTHTTAAATVTPASGPVLKRRTFELNVPMDYRLDPPHKQYRMAITTDGCSAITAIEAETVPHSLDAEAKIGKGLYRWTRGPKRLANVKIAGSVWYHLRGRQSSGKDYPQVADQYGTSRHGRAVVVAFQLGDSVGCVQPDEYRKDEVESVLATIRWR